MMTLFRLLSVGRWRRSWPRKLFATVGVALGVATWIASTLLAGATDQAVDHRVDAGIARADLRVTNGDSGVPLKLVEELRLVPGVRDIQPRVVDHVVITELGDRPIILIGADDVTAEQNNDDIVVSALPSASSMRSPFFGRRSVLVGRELLNAIGNQAVLFHLRAGGRIHRVSAAAVLDGHGLAGNLAGMTILMSVCEACDLLKRDHRATRFDIKAEAGVDHSVLQQSLQSVLAGRASVRMPEQHGDRLREAMEGLKIGFALSGAAALGLGIFLVYSLLAVEVTERRCEIGVLRALGATSGQILFLFLTEAFTLGVVGGIAGLYLGVFLARFAAGPLQGVLSDLFLPMELARLSISLWSAILAISLGTLAALLAAVVPSWQASKVPPNEAIRRETKDSRGRRATLQFALASCLILAGAACALIVSLLPERIGPYVVMGLPLLGLCILIPLIPPWLALFAQQRFPLLPLAFRLAFDNIAQASQRTGVVVAGIAVSVGLMIQMGGVIRSNRAGVGEWVQQSIAGDLFVTSGGPMSASGRLLPMAQEVGERLAEELPGAEIVSMRFCHVDWRWRNRDTQILLVSLDARAYHQANETRLPPLPDLSAYRKLCEPGGCIVSNNFASLYGVREGDRITIPAESGPLELTVVGTTTDYSCSRGTILIDRTSLGMSVSDRLVDVFDVYLPNSTDAESARQRLQSAPIVAAASLYLLPKQELSKHILGMIDRLYGIAIVQEAVVATTATLGVLAAMAISVLLRSRELAVLRAQGATRLQIIGIVVAESLILGAIGVVLGIAVGISLDWFAIHIVLPAETGFGFPFVIPWLDAVVLTISALAMSAMMGVLPGYRATRIPITDALAYE